MKKFTKLLLVVIAMIMLLPACGQSKEEFTEEAARSYVKFYLKAIMTGDVEDYSKLTGESEEDLEKQYEEILDSYKDELMSMAVFEDGAADQCLTSITKTLSSTKYEVGQAKKDEDGNYHVEVKVYPSDVMKVFMTKFVGMIQSTGLDGDGGAVIAEALDRAVDEQSFGEAVSYQVRVNKDSEGVYVLDINDVQPVVFGMFEEMNDIFDNSKVYENPYFNWRKADWKGASEEERTQCCLAMLQYMGGFTDEQMEMVNQNIEMIKPQIEEMKEGVDLGYSTYMDFSIGTFVEFMMNTGILDQIE